ncbi:MAG: carbon-nitrogen hydrolase [Helicobacteraceae bacterium]|jgi:N-carbamoylputrescine amidase|nr:carbon-nitrogen hydrolase [Helicobacteraceae bacterium]
MFKAAIIQQSFTRDIKFNTEKCAENIKIAAKNGAKLIALSELHNSLYFCQSEDVSIFDLAEEIPGKSTEFFGKLAQDLNVVLVLSLFERRARGLYHNTAVVVERTGEVAGIFRKMHIPEDPSFYEKFYFAPGDLGFKPIATSLGKIGVLVCWDQWYPEAARIMALNGAEILIYPTAIGWDPNDSLDEKNRQLDAWITIQRSHGIANALPVLSINRAGLEKGHNNEGCGIDFWGHSFIAGSQGEFLARSTDQNETILYAEINYSQIDRTRNIWPFLRDRRIDFYADLLKRFGG